MLFLFHSQLVRKSEASKRFESNTGLPGVDETPSQGQSQRPRYVIGKNSNNTFPVTGVGGWGCLFKSRRIFKNYPLLFSPFSFSFLSSLSSHKFIQLIERHCSLSYWTLLKLELALIGYGLCLIF